MVFVAAWLLIRLASPQIMVWLFSLSCQDDVEQCNFMNYATRAVTCDTGMNEQWTAGMIKVYMEDWFFFLAYTPKLFLGGCLCVGGVSRLWSLPPCLRSSCQLSYWALPWVGLWPQSLFVSMTTLIVTVKRVWLQFLFSFTSIINDNGYISYQWLAALCLLEQFKPFWERPSNISHTAFLPLLNSFPLSSLFSIPSLLP